MNRTTIGLLCATVLVSFLQACSDDASGSGSVAAGGTATVGGASGSSAQPGSSAAGTLAAVGGNTVGSGSANASNPKGGAGSSTGGPSVGGTAIGSGGAGGGVATGSGGAGSGGAGSGGAGSGGAGSGGAGSGGATGGTTSIGGAVAVGGAPLGGATALGGSSAGGGTATVPSQTGNPLNGIVSTYASWLSSASGDAAKLTADRSLADNIITWQMPHGGWFKYGKTVYASPWNGSDPRSDWTGANGVELGTIDNGGTVTEIMFLADVYRRTSDTKYQSAARKGLDFILNMQYASGGFPQVYPARPNSYSNYVTFNDDAMVRVLGMLDLAAARKTPFTDTTFSSTELARIPSAKAKAIDYILKAQIIQASVKTVWCAQHDPVSYAPMGARSYELPSKSGKESIGVIGYLLSQPQTADIRAAVQAAIAWYKSDAVKVPNTAYVSRPSGSTDDTYNPIQAKSGSTMWYRFYDLGKDTGFFSGRLPTDNPPGVGKKYDIMEIEPERRYGYQWGGSYGTSLFAYTDKIGY
ncbi:MAG: pectate lyase [Polyangiaceae bacterium]